MKAGSLASYTIARSTVTPGVISLTPAMPMVGSSTIAINVVNADLDQIVALLASGNISITVDQASLSAGVLMVASTGSTIAVNIATLGGIIPITANSSITITPDITMTALANMVAAAGGPTPLSPEGLAEAVWNAVLSDFQATGSTGKALNDAGAGGNPWTAPLASNTDPGTFGKRIQDLLTKSLYLGTKD